MHTRPGWLTLCLQRKYKESKAEASAAQSNLEKEITSLRDANRTLQLKLRDIEVANDDMERHARHTTSSLEDLESKYNIAIERGVMLEEEIKLGEQERERLRVEAQRLREELSDLKIEAEILQDKIRKQNSHMSNLSTDLTIPGSPSYLHSPRSNTSSPMNITTPPDTKSLSTIDTISEPQDPPSPPMSDVSMPLPKLSSLKTPNRLPRSRLPSADCSITPKPRPVNASSSSSRGGARSVTTSISSETRTTETRPPEPRRPRPSGPRESAALRAARAARGVSSTNSLTHIRTLTAQMQKLEARVHSARSKLPNSANTKDTPFASAFTNAYGPDNTYTGNHNFSSSNHTYSSSTSTPPRPSTRSASGNVSGTLSIRTRKRTVGSNASTSSQTSDEQLPPPSLAQSRHPPSASRSSIASASKHVPRLSSSSGVSRFSHGPLPNRNPTANGSTINHHTPSHKSTDSDLYSRPSSRTSMSSSTYGRPPSRAAESAIPIPSSRPMSRASSTRTPLSRPRSSMGVHNSVYSHGHSGSMSYTTTNEAADESLLEDDESDYRRTPTRRGGYETGIPLPGSGIPVRSRRPSGASSVSGMRRVSNARVYEDLGETY